MRPARTTAPIAEEAEPIAAEPEPIAAEPEPIAAGPLPLPAPQPAADPPAARGPADRAVRRGTRNERPRRSASRLPAAGAAAGADAVESADPTPTEQPVSRRRRGTPADRPRGTRNRRRGVDIPLLDPPANGSPTTNGAETRSRRRVARLRHAADPSVHPRGLVERPRDLAHRPRAAGARAADAKRWRRRDAAGDRRHASGVHEGAADWVEPDAIVTQLRRKTGGRGQLVRKGTRPPVLLRQRPRGPPRHAS